MGSCSEGWGVGGTEEGALGRGNSLGKAKASLLNLFPGSPLEHCCLRNMGLEIGSSSVHLRELNITV